MLSLTHELEVAREEAAAAEEARAASVKEYERALAGRVSVDGWNDMVGRLPPPSSGLICCCCCLTSYTTYLNINHTRRSWSCAPVGPSCGRTGLRLGA